MSAKGAVIRANEGTAGSAMCGRRRELPGSCSGGRPVEGNSNREHGAVAERLFAFRFGFKPFRASIAPSNARFYKF